MATIIEKIVKSNYPPDNINVMWLKEESSGNTLYAFGDTGWEKIALTDKEIDDLLIEMNATKDITVAAKDTAVASANVSIILAGISTNAAIESTTNAGLADAARILAQTAQSDAETAETGAQTAQGITEGFRDETEAFKNSAASIVSGGPRGTYADLAALILADPDHLYTYVTLDNGYWNYWDGSTFVGGALYLTVLGIKGYLFVGIATTSTVPPTYTANDRVYYLIDCPASATTLTLTNFGGLVIPILTVPTRYSLRWGGAAWSGVVDIPYTDLLSELNIKSNTKFNTFKVNTSLITNGSAIPTFFSLVKDIYLQPLLPDSATVIAGDSFEIKYISYKSTAYAPGFVLQIVRTRSSVTSTITMYVPLPTWIAGQKILKMQNGYRIYIYMSEIEPSAFENIEIKGLKLSSKAIDYNYKSTFTVSKSGGDYDNIQSALDNCNDSATNPVTILLKSGIYSKFSLVKKYGDAFNNLRYISIIGDNKNDCIVFDGTGLSANTPAEVRTSGIIKNITFLADHTLEVDPSINPVKSYGVHLDFGSQNVLFEDCILISRNAPAAGIGLHDLETIKFKNCELISDIPTAYWAYAYVGGYGALFAHAYTSLGATAQKLMLENCILQATNENVTLAACITRVGTNWSQDATAVLINNTFYSKNNGFGNLRMNFMLDGISHGNNNSNLNNVSSTSLL